MAFGGHGRIGTFGIACTLHLMLLLLLNALAMMVMAGAFTHADFLIFSLFGHSASPGVGRTLILLAQGLIGPVELTIFQVQDGRNVFDFNTK